MVNMGLRSCCYQTSIDEAEVRNHALMHVCAEHEYIRLHHVDSPEQAALCFGHEAVHIVLEKEESRYASLMFDSIAPTTLHTAKLFGWSFRERLHLAVLRRMTWDDYKVKPDLNPQSLFRQWEEVTN